MTAVVAIMLFKAVFWIFLLGVAGMFVFALLSETIESIRRKNKRAKRPIGSATKAVDVTAWDGQRSPSVAASRWSRIRVSSKN